jgi:hypothetical protein
VVTARRAGSRRSRIPAPRRLLSAGTAVALAVVVTLSACAGDGAGDDEGATTTPPAPVTPASRGDRCTDVAGDLGESTKASGALREPAGIDLLEASAELTPAGLEVRFRTAGPPQLAPEPSFFVFQGPSGRPGSFEIQAEYDPGAAPDAGAWAVTLLTYDGTTAPKRTRLPVDVSVGGDGVSFVVPTESVPPVATVYWAWGSRSAVGEGVTLIDDCDPFAQAASTTTTAP